MSRRHKETIDLCERVFNLLRRSPRRMTTIEIAREARCSKQKVYLVIGILRDTLATQGGGISSERSIGYQIAGQIAPNKIDENERVLEMLWEAAKSASRGFSHFRKQAERLSYVRRDMLSDPDATEMYGIQCGIRAAMSAVMVFEQQMKEIASRKSKKLISAARRESTAPTRNFGLSSFRELLAAARSDRNDDDDDDGAA